MSPTSVYSFCTKYSAVQKWSTLPLQTSLQWTQFISQLVHCRKVRPLCIQLDTWDEKQHSKIHTRIIHTSLMYNYFTFTFNYLPYNWIVQCSELLLNCFCSNNLNFNHNCWLYWQGSPLNHIMFPESVKLIDRMVVVHDRGTPCSPTHLPLHRVLWECRILGVELKKILYKSNKHWTKINIMPTSTMR